VSRALGVIEQFCRATSRLSPPLFLHYRFVFFIPRERVALFPQPTTKDPELRPDLLPRATELFSRPLSRFFVLISYQFFVFFHPSFLPGSVARRLEH